ncbi:hypothetical protein K438DRAFT_1904949 [Mycena galopus ATCC 62051]|nr:hypothetical protein K438DRAFT_1904949 [Mycena galopus ATCC 62051]
MSQQSAPYDIIFAGGGTTACVVAGRLAAADPSLKILVVPTRYQTHTQPGRFFQNLITGGDTFTFHVAKPSEALGNRPVVIPVGKGVGGGSCVNYWESLSNPGWGSKDLIPLSNKQYLAVAAARDKERGFTEDANDFSSNTPYNPFRVRRGNASSSAHHYVYNQQNDNLHILAHCRVKRVLFDGDRAIGVEYIKQEAVVAVHASRLVVLSSGAFGSPASSNGACIPQIVDLPGVGENYNAYEDQWLRDDLKADGKGMMAHNGIEAGIKIRPNVKDLEVLGPSFSTRWQEFFANRPDKPVMWIGPLAGYAGVNASAKGKLYVMGYYSEYPASLGRTHINSTDPYAPLTVEPGFLDKPEDLAILRWSYKWSREFALDHPQFPAGSAAACGTANGPVPIDAPDIVYLGTCAMKPQSQKGVVDPRLNVYGVKNLKVADLSVVPTNVAANTYNTALVVGEKAALLIAEDLGIKGV